MKTKDLTSQLAGLIGQAGPATGPVPGNYVDSIPEELDPDPVFAINYKSEQKQAIKRAQLSIMIIVKEVVPAHLQKSALIQDKVRQDAEQLGNLYYQYKKKETYHQALMETIACGLTDSKRFEVCEKISSSLEDLGAKITTLQNLLRKYYIDTYLDMQAKEDAESIAMSLQEHTLGVGVQQNAIGNQPQGNVITGTEETVIMLEQRKKLALMAKYQKAKEEE